MSKLDSISRWIVILVPLCLVSVGCNKHSQTVPVIPPPTSKPSEKFLSNPDAASWQRLVDDGKAEDKDVLAAIASHLAVYDEARLQRDLPNSMTREGKVDEYLREQDQIMRKEFAALGEFSQEDVWKLLTILCKQQFEEDLVWTAAEISYRYSPSRLSEIGRGSPARNREIIAYVKSRFEAGHGHIGEW